jgi:hypothetical protein
MPSLVRCRTMEAHGRFMGETAGLDDFIDR